MPWVLPIGPGLACALGLTAPFFSSSGMGPSGLFYPSGLLAVHPHGVPGAHQRLAVDVDAAALADAVANPGVGPRHHALAAAGFVAGGLVHIAFVVQEGGLAAKKDVGRAVPALVHGVGDRVGDGIAVGEAHVGQGADEDELGVLGGGGFVGHGVSPLGRGVEEVGIGRPRRGYVPGAEFDTVDPGTGGDQPTLDDDQLQRLHVEDEGVDVHQFEQWHAGLQVQQHL